MESIECQSQANRCSNCVAIAKHAFRETLDGTPGLTDVKKLVIVENSGIQTLVEERPGVDMLSCHDRQELAKKIGKRLGNVWK